MSSGTKVRTEIVPAGGSIAVGPGNFLMLISTAAAVTVRFIRRGTSFGAENVEAGYVKGLVEPWEKCYIDGTPGGTVRFFTGDEQVEEDFTDYRRTVGVFQPQQPATVSDAADVVVGVAATQLVAANAARRSVTLKSLDTSVGNIRVGLNGTVGVARGLQLVPGQSVTIEATGAIHGIQEGGGAASLCVIQENY